MKPGWNEPAHPFAASSCYCGCFDCPECNPNYEFLVYQCEDCLADVSGEDVSDEECPYCGGVLNIQGPDDIPEIWSDDE